MVEDIKALFKVLFLFLPLPVFWTLFDQQVTWTTSTHILPPNPHPPPQTRIVWLLTKETEILQWVCEIISFTTVDFTDKDK